MMQPSWRNQGGQLEHAEHPDTLSLVEDILWVIQQMKKGMTTKRVAKKQACHGDAEIFTRKTYVYFLLIHALESLISILPSHRKSN